MRHHASSDGPLNFGPPFYLIVACTVITDVPEAFGPLPVALVQSFLKLDVTTIVDPRRRPVEAIDQHVNMVNIALLRPCRAIGQQSQCQ